ncbi:uncharacterized protein DUF4012 [Homoserinimonas aerilata]|uniref:Uncharacterized protein DUF4012 n=1 Tax=Homoserinimonas aerilata TaxID=1162970 RepID=A0A542YKM3_9MICO|nr:uncharacterized protein DUF4012 [Homoserinimonas aerilata]
MPKWLPWTILAVVLLLIAAAAWIGLRALQAKTELETAQGLVGTLKTQLVTFEMDGATETLDNLKQHTSSARDLTGDPIWRVAEVFPGLGKNLTVVRELAEATDDVVVDVIAPLIGVAETIDPSSLAPVDGAINLQPLQDALPVLSGANGQMQTIVAKVKNVDSEGTISQVSAAQKQLAGLLDSVAPTLDTLDRMLAVVPGLLGADGPRNYIVMFQNNAEARALGGTALSFVGVSTDQGRITIGQALPAGLGNFDRYETSVLPIPDGAEQIYSGGAYGTFIPNVTVRPSFTTAAQLTQEMFSRKYGDVSDGVISIDPVALSYVLGATDPVTLSTGDVLDRDSLVPFLLNGIYQKYSALAQDAIYAETVDAVVDRILGGSLDPAELIKALVRGWDENRVLFYSNHEDVQAVLTELGQKGELPLSDSETDRVGVYFQENVGSKLNFYLQQKVTLAKATCRDDGRQTYRVTVDLTSTVPADAGSTLSPSILGNYEHEGLNPGAQRMVQLIYAPPGSTINSATVNGGPLALGSYHDEAYPVSRVQLLVEPGATVTISYDITAPEAGEKALEAQITPMVNPTTIEESTLDCATVPVP